jgi:hypothetical protein
MRLSQVIRFSCEAFCRESIMNDEWGHVDVARVHEDTQYENQQLITDNCKLQGEVGVLKKQLAACNGHIAALSEVVSTSDMSAKLGWERVRRLEDYLERLIDVVEEYVPPSDAAVLKLLLNSYAVLAGAAPDED